MHFKYWLIDLLDVCFEWRQRHDENAPTLATMWLDLHEITLETIFLSVFCPFKMICGVFFVRSFGKCSLLTKSLRTKASICARVCSLFPVGVSVSKRMSKADATERERERERLNRWVCLLRARNRRQQQQRRRWINTRKYSKDTAEPKSFNYSETARNGSNANNNRVHVFEWRCYIICHIKNQPSAHTFNHILYTITFRLESILFRSLVKLIAT